MRKHIATIFDGGGGTKPQIIYNNVSKIFKKRNLLWDKDTIEGRIKSLVWHVTRISLKGENLNKELAREIIGVWGQSYQPLGDF